MMFCVRALLMVLVLGGPAWGFDPRAAEILALRLGMTSAEVSGKLRTQVQNVPEEKAGTITARTVDGEMRVDFSQDGRVHRITYTIFVHGTYEFPLIRAALVERYGQPSAPEPLAWCLTPSSMRCPSDLPVLAFSTVGKEAAVLVLAIRADP